jgi:hypothetical protein
VVESAGAMRLSAQAPHAKALAALRIAFRNYACRPVLPVLLFPISDNGRLKTSIDTSEQAPVFVQNR